MHLLLVGVGGALGGIVRYRLGKVISQRSNTTFPVGTFLINLTGAFLLGILTGGHMEEHYYLLAAEGFLGAYTTFSTFMYEGFHLFYENERKNAAFYMIGSLLLGILGYAAGLKLMEL